MFDDCWGKNWNEEAAAKFSATMKSYCSSSRQAECQREVTISRRFEISVSISSFVVGIVSRSNADPLIGRDNAARRWLMAAQETVLNNRRACRLSSILQRRLIASFDLDIHSASLCVRRHWKSSNVTNASVSINESEWKRILERSMGNGERPTNANLPPT